MAKIQQREDTEKAAMVGVKTLYVLALQSGLVVYARAALIVAKAHGLEKWYLNCREPWAREVLSDKNG